MTDLLVTEPSGVAEPMKGKAALVTGSGRGTGPGFAERLAGLGYSVGIHGLVDDEPSEYGEGATVTDTAAQIGEKLDVPTLCAPVT